MRAALAATIKEVEDQIDTLTAQAADAERLHDQAMADEDRAWPIKQKEPRNPAAWADALRRRAAAHSRHLGTVSELVNQQKHLAALSDPAEYDRWLADAAAILVP